MRPCPTLTGGCSRLVHPYLHRPLSVLELATIMGWEGCVPIGPNPWGQIAKGVCPAVAEWVAQQCARCLDDEWGGEDWESSFDAKTGQFDGRDTKYADVKVMNFTQYHGRLFDRERYPEECDRQWHRFNVDEEGRLKRPWKELPNRRP